jgi:hypothetical protein
MRSFKNEIRYIMRIATILTALFAMTFVSAGKASAVVVGPLGNTTVVQAPIGAAVSPIAVKPLVNPFFRPAFNPFFRPVFNPFFRPVFNPFFRPVFNPFLGFDVDLDLDLGLGIGEVGIGEVGIGAAD